MPSLIVRLPNHLGDACMALPALDGLAAAGHEIALAGRPWAAELFSAYAWPVTALAGGRCARIGALRALRAARAPARAALLLTNSFSTALEFRLAGLQASGYARDARGFLLHRALAVPRAWREGMHAIDYYSHLAASLGGRARAGAVPSLRLGADAHARASAALARAGGVAARGYVVLCPIARGRHHGQDKRWNGFGRLGEELRAAGESILVCPGPGEAADAAVAVPAARLVESLDLGAFGALLCGARLVLANDSGPAHLAAAVGAPLICVLGVTEPERTCPRGPSVRAVGGKSAWPEYEAVKALAWNTLGR